jgi:hypothetical protein
MDWRLARGSQRRWCRIWFSGQRLRRGLGQGSDLSERRGSRRRRRLAGRHRQRIRIALRPPPPTPGREYSGYDDRQPDPHPAPRSLIGQRAHCAHRRAGIRAGVALLQILEDLVDQAHRAKNQAPTAAAAKVGTTLHHHE